MKYQMYAVLNCLLLTWIDKILKKHPVCIFVLDTNNATSQCWDICCRVTSNTDLGCFLLFLLNSTVSTVSYACIGKIHSLSPDFLLGISSSNTLICRCHKITWSFHDHAWNLLRYWTAALLGKAFYQNFFSEEFGCKDIWRVELILKIRFPVLGFCTHTNAYSKMIDIRQPSQQHIWKYYL